MNRLAGLAALLLTICTTPLAYAERDDEAELELQILRAEKKLTVLRNMGLTDKEKQAFWPVYEDYQDALRKLNVQSARMIATFAREYSSMTDEVADDLLQRFLDIRQSRLELQKSFLPRFKKALPPIKVARYYQIENKLQTMAECELAEEIPLIK
jgi:hypothetical protein